MSQKKYQETVPYSGKDPKEKDKANQALRTICSNGVVFYELSEDQTSCVLCAPTQEALKNAVEKYNKMTSESNEITEETEVKVLAQLERTTTEIEEQSKVPKSENKNEKADQTQADGKHDRVRGSGSLCQHENKTKGNSEEQKNNSVSEHEDEKRHNLKEGVQAKSLVKSDSQSKKESTIGKANIENSQTKLKHTMSNEGVECTKGDKIETNDGTESANKMKDRQLEVNETSIKGDVCNIKDEMSSVEKETVSKALPKIDIKPDLSFPDKVEIVSSEGFKIKIYQHDLLETNVDAIVNAANEKLSHGAGVAEVIAKRAGPEMSRECTDYIKKNKSLTVSKAFASGAGKLNFKKIIHVVGPAWWEYKDKVKCLNDLAKTITNLLEKAKECRVRTVAMPTISSGRPIYNFCFIFIRLGYKSFLK